MRCVDSLKPDDSWLRADMSSTGNDGYLNPYVYKRIYVVGRGKRWNRRVAQRVPAIPERDSRSGGCSDLS